jgi:hypothetical protein
MTPADLARENAISFECKKDALQQRQSGDWKISFTVQGVDMDERITRAAMGTRFVAVLVEVNDDESPVRAKEQPAKPRPESPTAGAKREKMDWRDVQPAAQAGIRCADPTFRAFLRETRNFSAEDKLQAEIAVRDICHVNSRVEFGTDTAKRILWHQLDTEYQAWKLVSA